MKYTKPALTIEQQADQLLSRGLIADRKFLISILSDISYYRLSGYFYPYRDQSNNTFKKNTQFAIVFDHYLFDRQLRVLVMDAIERIEVSIKTRLVNQLTLKFGPFAHTDIKNFPRMPVDSYQKFLEKIHIQTEKSKEQFITHYRDKYTSENEAPLWMVAEIIDFGGMLTLFKNCDKNEKRMVATYFGVSEKVLESWLTTLNIIRNICAHHGRLWNRIIPVPLVIPFKKNRPEFHDPGSIGNDRMFGVLSVIQYMLAIIAKKSKWSVRLRHLLTDKHPNIPLKSLGFPNNWDSFQIWKNKATEEKK
jgi:abortive infection bacteriophage resistance protein